jgi:hypothetical protein
LAANSSAAIITIGIEATVNYLNDNDNLLEGKVAIGSIITGTYTYDTDTPDTNPASDIGNYLHYSPPCGILLVVGGFNFMSDPSNTNFGVGITDNYQGLMQDNYGLGSHNNLPLSNEVLVDYISWSLSDYSGTALSSTALSTTAPILSDWDYDYNILTMAGGIGGISPCYDKTFYIEAEVISAVLIPEPISLLLFGLGTIAIIRNRN